MWRTMASSTGKPASRKGKIEMSICEMMDELRVISRVRRHFTRKDADLDQIIDLDRVLNQEAQALQDKIPGGIVVWDESTSMYGIYPLDR